LPDSRYTARFLSSEKLQVTQCYTPPEVAAYNESPSPLKARENLSNPTKADIYALGKVIIESLDLDQYKNAFAPFVREVAEERPELETLIEVIQEQVQKLFRVVKRRITKEEIETFSNFFKLDKS